MAAAIAMQVQLLRTTRASPEQLARSDELLAAVHDEVHAYVRLLRALDTTPEETVIQVKAAVGEAVGRHGPIEEALMASVVTWAVDAYYTG